ncbi:Uncharacterized protein PECH_005432 [Penicillium ucsense]|uniref:Uncharacterized protein n=1 Tax=Penicillium ucsense TaxID=2839758 RepID=A0A8J8W4B8_9EURO|nr:Uncharacterized protein PECM_005971 [Penicillium ucsense]KAF7736331.1 Uncharacterized protein PECH_005432 [Penicillium ucsense]
MDQLRQEARAVLQRNPWKRPDFLRSAFAATAKNGLADLWQDLASHDSDTHLDVCENLYTAFCFVDGWDTLLPNDQGPRQLNRADTEAVTRIFHWASALALPSSAFATEFDDFTETTQAIKSAQEDSRLRSTLAIQLILQLSAKAPACLEDRTIVSAPDVVLAAACFTDQSDPWTTEDSYEEASMYLNVALQRERWSIIDKLLKEKLRPLFTKIKNPAITTEGRKNFHPTPLSRFDGTVLNDELKPWKFNDIYATRILAWIISQYQSSSKSELEAHFPLMVPALLALIDDNSLTFKRIGCELFSKVLQPIQKSGSDILLRTNLTSVFEDAIAPCLLSLPTITPEDDSLKLLGAAYPALLSLFQTAYEAPRPKSSKDQAEKAKEKYIAKVTKILRSNLVSSFHHISSSTPATLSTSASFPHPRLSAFLVEWMIVFIKELGIHTTKYLQGLVPVVYAALCNPFGTAYPPLLLAATSATKFLVLNAHPRIWRWRGELLGALCACWLQIIGEKEDKEKESGKRNLTKTRELELISKELQVTVFVLKKALQNPVPFGSVEPDADQLHTREALQQELQMLIEADSELNGLLFADIRP